MSDGCGKCTEMFGSAISLSGDASEYESQRAIGVLGIRVGMNMHERGYNVYCDLLRLGVFRQVVEATGAGGSITLKVYVQKRGVELCSGDKRCAV